MGESWVKCTGVPEVGCGAEDGVESWMEDTATLNIGEMSNYLTTGKATTEVEIQLPTVGIWAKAGSVASAYGALSKTEAFTVCVRVRTELLIYSSRECHFWGGVFLKMQAS